MNKITECYYFCIPVYYQERLSNLKSHISDCFQALYTGVSDHRCTDARATEFLRSKAFFVSSDPWELARTLAFLAVIAAVGYLLTQAGLIIPGVVCVSLAGLLGGSVLYNWYLGNHLENALQDIVKKPINELPTLAWSKNDAGTVHITQEELDKPWKVAKGINSDQKPVWVAFKDGERVKIYYFGSAYLKLIPFTGNPDQKLSCTNMLKGTEIADLLTIASSI